MRFRLDDVFATERQFLNVACTRARDRLHLTGVKPRWEFLEDSALCPCIGDGLNSLLASCAPRLLLRWLLARSYFSNRRQSNRAREDRGRHTWQDGCPDVLGTVEGDIHHNSLTIAKGAELTGRCRQNEASA